MIKAAWAEQKAIKEVMMFLQGVGVSTSLAVKIYKKYGDESVTDRRAEPYRLASDVWGIGFKTADTIAASVGIAKDSPERIKAGLAYTLSEAADDGHCYLPEPNLVTDAAKILEVPADMIAPRLDAGLAAEGAWSRIRAGPGRRGRRGRTAGRRLPAAFLPWPNGPWRLPCCNLLAAGADRLAAFQRVDWDKALGLAHGADRRRPRPRAGRGGQAGPDRRGSRC